MVRYKKSNPLGMHRSKVILLSTASLMFSTSTFNVQAYDACYDDNGNYICEIRQSVGSGSRNSPGGNMGNKKMETFRSGGVLDYVLKQNTKNKHALDLDGYAKYLKKVEMDMVPQKLLVDVHSRCGLKYGYKYTKVSPHKMGERKKANGISVYNYDVLTAGKIGCLITNTPKRKFGSAKVEDDLKKTIRRLCKLAANSFIPQETKIDAWDDVKESLNGDEYLTKYAEQLVNKRYYCKDRLGIEFVFIPPEEVIDHGKTKSTIPTIPSFY